MKWLTAALVLGSLAGWCAARFVSGSVATVMSVVVLAMVLGLLPLGRLGRRVLWRADA